MLLWSAGAFAAGELTPYDGDPTAPGLTLADLDGNTHALEDYRGHVVLVNFWGSWCPPCVREMPSLQRLHESMAGRPFTVLAVNVRQTRPTVTRFAERLGLAFTVLLDPWGTTYKTWKVRVFPSSFLLDPTGQIRYTVVGELEWDDAETVRVIESLMPARVKGVSASKGSDPFNP